MSQEGVIVADSLSYSFKYPHLFRGFTRNDSQRKIPSFNPFQGSVEGWGRPQPTKTMRIALYILGSMLVAGAVAYAAITLLGLPPVWVGIACLIILGFGIMGAARTGPSSRRTTTTTTTNAAPANQVTVTERDDGL